MSNLMDTFIAKYGQSDNIRVVKSPLRICPIGAHSEYQGDRVTGMTLDASVDMVYAPREDNYVEIQEGLSVSLMEAMAMGKPVLASKIRGNVDLIDAGKSGYLFNPVDVEKLANLIDLMLDNQSLREKVGIYNKEKIKGFSVNNDLNKLYKVYSKI